MLLLCKHKQMKKITLLTILVFSILFAKSQTYTSTAGGSIPDAGPQVSFPMNVSGLSPATIDTIFGLETVCLTITHTWDADLSIKLQLLQIKEKSLPKISNKKIQSFKKTYKI